MTYCLAMLLNEGIVCLSDTRTNAGLDNISKFRKSFTWEIPGDRAICLMTAGNLAITQAVIGLLQENIDEAQPGIDTLLSAQSMFRVAEIVGDAMRTIQQRHGTALAQMGESSLASIIVAGQRKGGRQRLFHIYAAGNFVEATEDSPYFQIGEHKYGKPIIDRVITRETPLKTAVTAALLSMDSTTRSNLSVGMPLDLTVLRAEEFCVSDHRRIEADDPQFDALSKGWSQALRNAFDEMDALWN
ncbi:peptidase [Donghicola sp. XS_ASV15]|uniref:peptidase n=1 Tax=Donghicola sp. XS_ASV15 TaxID=3241295 RepID=UPI00351612F8